jgi:hypothetical protein
MTGISGYPLTDVLAYSLHCYHSDVFCLIFFSEHEADWEIPFGVPQSSMIVGNRTIGFEEGVVFPNGLTPNTCSQVNTFLCFFTGLENRNYGRKGSAALTMRHPSICKNWH